MLLEARFCLLEARSGQIWAQIWGARSGRGRNRDPIDHFLIRKVGLSPAKVRGLFFPNSCPQIGPQIPAAF